MPARPSPPPQGLLPLAPLWEPRPPPCGLCCGVVRGLGLLGRCLPSPLLCGVVRSLGLLGLQCGVVRGMCALASWGHHHHHHHRRRRRRHHAPFLGQLSQESGLSGARSWRQLHFQYPHGRVLGGKCPLSQGSGLFGTRSS